MTLRVSSSENRDNIDGTIRLLNQIIVALGEFKGNYAKKFNFSKLAEILKVPRTKIGDVLSLIMKFQEQFKSTFKNYELEEKVINRQIYVIAKKEEPKEVVLNSNQSNLISDLTYTFKFVEHGKGFNLDNPSNDFLKSVRTLQKSHPYLFRKNGNNLTYPSEIALKLGDQILSHNKSNKQFEKIRIKDYNIVINLL